MKDDFVEAEFDNLDACLEHVRKNYPDDKVVRIPAKDMDTNEDFETDVPAFLYRGEDNVYPSTTSSIMRLGESPLSGESIKRIEFLTVVVNNHIQDLLKVGKEESMAFLQHYGLPTQIIDFTSKLEVAANFAQTPLNGSSSGIGIIGVLPVAGIEKHSIFDLTNLSLGKRPRKQKAYGYYSWAIKDLKSDEALTRLGVRWFSFKQDSKQSKESRQSLRTMLDAHEDEYAGYIKCILDSLGKHDDEVARWLADHVAPTPLVMKVKSYHDQHGQMPKIAEFVPFGGFYDEAVERERNYRRWSNKHPDTAPSIYEKWRLAGHSPLILEALYSAFRTKREEGFEW